MGWMSYLLLKTSNKTEYAQAYQYPDKTKIQFSDNDFLKISKTNETVFSLENPRTVSQKELTCLARNIYHEARGESLLNMMGVAQITLNRVDIQHRGKNTICEVVNDPSQFSWVNSPNIHKKRIEKDAWQQAQHIAQLVLMGIRIRELENSIYFHSRNIKQPKWSRKLPVNKVIGNHVYLGELNVQFKKTAQEI